MMGRKPLLVYLSEDERAALDEAAERQGHSRSREVRRLIAFALGLSEQELRTIQADRDIAEAMAMLEKAQRVKAGLKP